MSSFDKKLLAVLGVLVTVFCVVVVLAVDVYNDNFLTAPTTVYYITLQGSSETTTSSEFYLFQNDNTTVASTQSANVQSNMVLPQNSQQSQNSHQKETATFRREMSNSEMLNFLTESINKTKSYSHPIVLTHTESFVADVTECTGGSLVASAANALVGMVLKPTNETLNFSNGMAVNFEGETVPILLPEKNNFSLNINDIKSISSQNNGNNTVVYVELLPENVGLYDIPAANAASIGYLNVAELDISILEVTDCSINYTGSSLKVEIRPDGYVQRAEYKIPMHVEGSAKAMGINGTAVFDGMQTEIWDFNW